MEFVTHLPLPEGCTLTAIQLPNKKLSLWSVKQRSDEVAVPEDVPLLLLSNPTCTFVDMSASAHASFPVHVKTLAGKTCTITASPALLIADLKAAVRDATSIPVDRQILLHLGTALEDGKPVCSCNIQSGATLFMVWRLCGVPPDSR